MRETETQMLIAVFGGHVLLAEALSIETYPPEIQDAILRRFCEYVFKKILLDVPQEEIGHVIDIFEEHRTSGRTFDALIDELRRVIPGMDLFIKDEITRSLAEFRLPERV